MSSTADFWGKVSFERPPYGMYPEDPRACSSKKSALGLLASLAFGLVLALWMTSLNLETRRTEQVAYARTTMRGIEGPDMCMLEEPDSHALELWSPSEASHPTYEEFHQLDKSDDDAVTLNALLFMSAFLVAVILWSRVTRLIQRVGDLEKEVNYLHTQAVSYESTMSTTLSLARSALSIAKMQKG